MDGSMHGHGHGHGHDMMTPSPSVNGTGMVHHHKMMMHMSFFWGTNSEILFHGWPGASHGMYALAIVLVFSLAVIVEWLSNSRIIRSSSGHVTAGLVQTLMHTIRVALAYMVMLAVMSFNVGVFLVVVAGHAVGFLLFGSRVFKTEDTKVRKMMDLPPMSC